VENAVDFIAALRQAEDKGVLPIGRRVVVIGGGMTAIDAAVQAKLLGAEEVTVCYRRGQEQMNASDYEQELAKANGVVIRHWLQPKRVLATDGRVSGIELEYTALADDRLVGTGRALVLEADQVFKAIGQSLDASLWSDAGSFLQNGKIKVDAEGRTSIPNVWAGGDCVAGGEDLTVWATRQGRDAAESIHRSLTAQRAPAAPAALELA
jgi:glutamate synthase (NADPH/NADH) small chain